LPITAAAEPAIHVADAHVSGAAGLRKAGGRSAEQLSAARRRRDILSLLGNGSRSSLLAPPSMSRNYDVG
jgi:hypothetical protein